MINISDFVKELPKLFPTYAAHQPWQITSVLSEIVRTTIPLLGNDYVINGDIAIHKTATVENGVTLKGPIIIGPECIIGANAYLRAGVFLSKLVTIGPGTEIKSSIIFSNSSAAHFNYIGDSIIGSHVNFEAGAVIANHHNERTNKQISISYQGKTIATGTEKFGALVGDGTKVGANAVLSPGTILLPNSVVKRLELIDQSVSN